MPHRAARALFFVVAVASVAAGGAAAAALAATAPASARGGDHDGPRPPHASFRDQSGRGPTTAAEAVGTGVRLRLPYSDWSWPESGYYADISETLTVERPTTLGAPFFWSHQFSFKDGSCTGVTYPCQGYVGLQDGVPEKLALFSIWDATAAEGPDCAPFSGEGRGYSCRLEPYEWRYDRAYVLRVRADGSGSRGVWYKATVTDTTSSVERTIGRIRVPKGRGGIQGWTSWTEYLGADPSDCAGFPQAVGRWSYPVAKQGQVSITGRSMSVGPGDCASRIVDVAGGHRQFAPK